jgi:hypothetical protein
MQCDQRNLAERKESDRFEKTGKNTSLVVSNLVFGIGLWSWRTSV